MTSTIENQQLKEMIGKVIEGQQTSPELLAWANDVDTAFVIELVDWITEKSDYVRDDCQRLLRFMEFLESNDHEKVKKALVVAEYIDTGR